MEKTETREKRMDSAYKIILTGDGGVGKSTFLRRVKTDEFIPQRMTLGLSHEELVIKVNNRAVHLICWDLGGEGRYEELHKLYSKGTHGFLFAYDCSRPRTLWNLEKWIAILREDNPGFDQVPKGLVGMKSDLKSPIDESAVANLIQKHGFKSHLSTSAKTGQNVSKLIEEFGRDVHLFFSSREGP